MGIREIHAAHKHSAACILYYIVLHSRIHVIQAPDSSLFHISKGIPLNHDVSVWSVVDHAVTAHSCKHILKNVIRNPDILTNCSIKGLIFWKNIVQTCIQLNAFLSAAFIFLPISPECTASHGYIFRTCQLKKMRFQIV